MTPANFERALRAFAHRKPFRSFSIEFVTGERLTISHPEAVFLVGELAFHTTPEFVHRFFDANSVCQLLDLK